MEINIPTIVVIVKESIVIQNIMTIMMLYQIITGSKEEIMQKGILLIAITFYKVLET